MEFVKRLFERATNTNGSSWNEPRPADLVQSLVEFRDEPASVVNAVETMVAALRLTPLVVHRSMGKRIFGKRVVVEVFLEARLVFRSLCVFAIIVFRFPVIVFNVGWNGVVVILVLIQLIDVLEIVSLGIVRILTGFAGDVNQTTLESVELLQSVLSPEHRLPGRIQVGGGHFDAEFLNSSGVRPSAEDLPKIIEADLTDVSLVQFIALGWCVSPAARISV